MGDFMYLPALVSIQDALEDAGAVTRIIDWSSDAEMLEGVLKAAAGGRQPLVVDVGTPFMSDESEETLQHCVHAGARLVLYATEPFDADRVQRLARDLGAHEVWEYALGNIDKYSPEFMKRTPVSYMPPGYSPQLDANVSLESAERREDLVGFMGGLNKRPQLVQQMYRDMFGHSMKHTYKVATKAQTHKFLGQLPLQLNLHKHQTCCPHDPDEWSAMESFRMAALLTNKACVVSTPISAKDQPLWEGIVHFAEANDTLDEVNRLRKNVTACQLEAARLFKERFDPARLLRESGFLSRWRPSAH